MEVKIIIIMIIIIIIIIIITCVLKLPFTESLAHWSKLNALTNISEKSGGKKEPLSKEK